MTQLLSNEMELATDTKDVSLEIEQEAIAFIRGVETTSTDMVVSTATVSVASMGTIHHDRSIESYVFAAGQNLVNNSRTYFVAGDEITNNKPIVTHHYGGGSVLSDSGSINICTGSKTVNRNPVKNVVRRSAKK